MEVCPQCRRTIRCDNAWLFMESGRLIERRRICADCTTHVEAMLDTNAAAIQESHNVE